MGRWHVTKTYKADGSVTACDRVLKADGFAARRAGKIGSDNQLEMSKVDERLAICDSQQKVARKRPL